jgi:lysophospholipase L1-like esterase
MRARIETPSLSKRKQLAFFLVWCGIASLVVFILSEVLVRIFLASCSVKTLRTRSLQYRPAIIVRHTLKPEQTVRPDSNRLWHINEYGYRGKSFSVAKPEGVIRIAILGGSAVFDQNVSDDRDWPHLIESDLRARGFANVEVLNAGIPGHASFDAFGKLCAHVWMFEPDYVLLYNAWNDIKYFRDLSPQRPLFLWMQEYQTLIDPRLNYQSGLDSLLSFSELYARLRLQYYEWKLNAGSEGVIPKGSYDNEYSDWAPKQYKLNVQMFVDAGRNIYATPILLTQATLVSPSNTPEERKRIAYQSQKLTHEAVCKAFQDCNRIMRIVAQEKGVGLIDLDAQLTGHGEFFSDHVHLTAKGGQTVAKIVAEFLANELRRTKKQMSYSSRLERSFGQ